MFFFNLLIQVVTVKEIFRLQNDTELVEAEKKYLPQKYIDKVFKTEDV